MGHVLRIIAILFVLFNHYSVSFVNSSSSTSLSVGYYDESCPEVENIIREELMRKMSPVPRNITIPGTLRLFFHDCYGCDGSVLILPTDENNSERNASINLSLPGDAFDIVDKSKAALERECPGVVSCSDILAILAREVTAWRWYHLECNRGRDLLMPKSDENITILIRGFEEIGLSTSDLVTLSGAHTIGFTHCKEFSGRIFNNYCALNSTIREKVIQGCPFPNIDDTVVEALDQVTEFVFDNNYYKSLRQRKAMVKLGRVGVNTGTNGEIRRDCKKFN
ncbi:hypothetical protein MKW98_026214 [Papaver atlanticum]|uniref:Plant heme peroxidase family profile domain-containing protein n=1 Tax=Papaver atlanticum TaxID=357466 RepID=A0AAD4XQH9_9MAGN|nr:hypothetical protein MKW98_026214 [Papaver atlanticum]